MSVTSNTLFDEILMYAPGCPSPVMRKELLRAAQRFCRRTLILQRDVPFVQPAFDEDHTFDLSLESLQVIQVLELTVNGRVISGKQQEALRQRNAYYRQITAPEPRLYYSKREGTVSFYPTPDQDVPVVAAVACFPSDTYEGLPEELLGQWQDAIVGGALSRLCSAPGQPYTNPEIAQRGAGWYAEGVAQARVYFNNSYGRGAMVTQRPFAAGKRKF